MEYSCDYSAPPTLAVDECNAPSISSTAIRNSESKIEYSAQRAVADEYHGQPPSYSGFQHAGNSINGFTGDFRVLDQTDNGVTAPDRDATVHVKNSATGFNNFYSGYEEAPAYSGMTPQNQSNPGASATAATPAFDPLENVGFTVVKRNFPRKNLMLQYNY